MTKKNIGIIKKAKIITVKLNLSKPVSENDVKKIIRPFSFIKINCK